MELHKRLQDRSVKKHSEQLNKYVAGLVDTDGSIQIKFEKLKGGRTMQLRMELGLIDGDLVEALRDAYSLGAIYKKARTKHDLTYWTLATKHAAIFLERINKHLLIKGTFCKWCLDMYRNLKHVRLTDEQVEEIKEEMRCQRKRQRWLREPKHISLVWLAGFLDGDGTYTFRQRRRYHKTDDRWYWNNILRIGTLQHKDFLFILERLKKDFGGRVHFRKSDGHPTWELSLGLKSRKIALPLLKKLRKFSCIPRKRDKIERMIRFHEEKLPAETERGGTQ